MSFAFGPPPLRNFAAVELDVFEKRADHSLEHTLKITQIPKRDLAMFPTFLHEYGLPIGRELVRAEGMRVADKFPGLLMHLTESFPAHARGDKSVNTTDLKQIEKPQGNRVVNLIKLGVPNSG